MRLDSFRTFHKVLNRLRTLYAVTIHSYRQMHDSGRATLRDPTQRDAKALIQLETRSLHVPLKVLTYHASDVYPQLFRSTLLIRLVASYEAYLIDVIDEIASRSEVPFASDKRHDLTQSELLRISHREGLLEYFVSKNTRSLTSGGLVEIRKFYKTSLGFDLLGPGQGLGVLQEIHDRRHLYVHRAGYADYTYCHTYPASGAKLDEIQLVDEQYLFQAMDSLYTSALHVKVEAESRFPGPIAWKYTKGNNDLLGGHEQIVLISAKARNSQIVAKVTDGTLWLPDANATLADVIVWMSTNGSSVRWLIAASRAQVKGCSKYFHALEVAGELSQVDSFKVLR